MFIIYTLTAEELRDKDARVEELLLRISGGESSPIGELYELIKNDVYAYAISKTANKENAEDITHDTFVQIYKNATQYKPLGKPMAWVFTIELNLVRRQANLNKRVISSDDINIPESDGGDFSDSIVNNAFLKDILRTLSDEEREIISLHIVSGLRHREIAKLLGKPISTVLSKYNRAIKKLQVIVKEKEET